MEDIRKLWVGMPHFKQDKKKPYKKRIIRANFKSSKTI